MNLATRKELIAINARFYRDTAPDFARTRRRGWPGWERLAELWPARAAQPTGPPPRVLDVGCGNARLAAHLTARIGPIDYLGIDSSAALLEVARNAAPRDSAFEVRCIDVLSGPPAAALPAGPFELVALFGVLHHVPGSRLRSELLAALGARVAPGGWLALTTWRFAEQERFTKRLLDWSALEASIDPNELEAGDLLLRWGDGGAVRYCHFLADHEIDSLLQEAKAHGLALLHDFHADGDGGALNRYLIFERPRA